MEALGRTFEGHVFLKLINGYIILLSHVCVTHRKEVLIRKKVTKGSV